MKYIFVLGRDRDLSYLELLSYFKSNNIKYKLEEINEKIIIAKIDNFDFKKAISELGGIVKIGVIINKDNLYEGSKNKISYAINYYSDDNLENYFKGWFKKNKIKALRKKKSTKNLNPRDISKDLIDYLCYKKYIGKTLVVSDLKDYKNRDKERPYNDFVRSISIRLAKILINLSQAKKNQKILDPFSGVGVILEEGIIRGFNVVGIDRDIKMVKESNRNLSFIKKKYENNSKFEIILGDSRKASKYVSKADVVVSEPYLGPYLRKKPDLRKATEIINELEGLYLETLKELRKIVKGLVVLIVPNIKTYNNKTVKMNFNKILKDSKFKIFNIDNNVKFPINYYDSKDIVLRDIYVLEKS